jgi:hypothetical protein
MTQILGFGFGRFFLTKSLLLSVLKLKNNFKISKFNFKFNSNRSRRKLGYNITPAKLFFENGRLLTNSSVSKL